MPVFEDIIRINMGPMPSNGNYYEYYNSSARQEIQNIRLRIESWFEEYPEIGKKDLESRLKGSNTEFLSAYFELFLYTLFKRMGYDVVLHPDTNKSTHPDFEVSMGRETKIYVEAISILDYKDQKAKDARIDSLIDCIENMKIDYSLRVIQSGTPNDNIPCKKVKKLISSGIAKIEGESTIKKDSHFFPQDIGTFEGAGYSLNFSVLPRSDRNVSVRFLKLGEADIVELLRTRIKKKATKYGDLSYPYIIAINYALQQPAWEGMIDIALYGYKTSNMHHGIDGSFSQYRGISGAMVFCANPSYPSKEKWCTIWNNPWAKYPLQPSKIPATQRTLDLKTMKPVSTENNMCKKIILDILNMGIR